MRCRTPGGGLPPPRGEAASPEGDVLKRCMGLLR